MFSLPVEKQTLPVPASKPTSIEKVCSCDSNVESLEFSDLPSAQQGEWYESTDPWYGLHYTCHVSFADGIKGKIFKGGTSKKYFIGDSGGGKYYYVNANSAARALYLYKKHGCISSKYRN